MKRSAAYGFGSLGLSVLGLVVGSWLLYFYLPPNGAPRLPAGLYGLATLLGYLVGAVLTPWVGHFSDNLQSRWGRRLPLLLAGAPLTALLFLMMWFPPQAGQSLWNLVYLAAVMILYRVASAFYQVPYQALLPELAVTDTQRVRLSAWQSAFYLIGIVLGGLAGVVIERYGYTASALLYAGLSMAALLIPLGAVMVATKAAAVPAVEPRLRFSLLHALRLTLLNRAFAPFALTWSLYLVTSAIVQSVSPFLATEVCGLSKADTLYFYLPAVAASLACYSLVVRSVEKWGKWSVYIVSLLASALVFPAMLALGEWLPVPLAAQCISWSVLQALAISGAVVLSSAFAAEIIDYDAELTGQRREGMYMAVLKVLDQTLTGAASLLLPLLLLLGRGRSDPNGPLGVRLTGVIAGVLMLIAAFCMSKYPLRKR